MMSSIGQPALSAPHSSHWIEIVLKVCILVFLSWLMSLVYTTTYTMQAQRETFFDYFFGFTKFKKAKIYRSAEATNPNACKMPSASPAKNKYKVASPAKTAKPDHLIRTGHSQ
jgi:uncharacterized membrane protein YadS